MSNLVKIYNPAGEVEEHTVANARDLVAHAGWTKQDPKLAIKALEMAQEKANKLKADAEAEKVKAAAEKAKAEKPKTAKDAK